MHLSVLANSCLFALLPTLQTICCICYFLPFIDPAVTRSAEWSAKPANPSLPSPSGDQPTSVSIPRSRFSLAMSSVSFCMDQNAGRQQPLSSKSWPSACDGSWRLPGQMWSPMMNWGAEQEWNSSQRPSKNNNGDGLAMHAECLTTHCRGQLDGYHREGETMADQKKLGAEQLSESSRVMAWPCKHAPETAGDRQMWRSLAVASST